MKKLMKLAVLVCILTALLVPGFTMAAHDFDYDHNMGVGYKSGVDLGNAAWVLDVNSSYANSQGYLFNGATGYVYCGVCTSESAYQDSDAYMSNSLTAYGNGTYAEIWFHNVVA